MTVELKIKEKLSQIILELYHNSVDIDSIKLESTNADFVGDFTFVVFPYVRYSKKSPEQTGHEIGSALQVHISEMKSFNCVKGFLNIELNEKYWLNEIKKYSQNKTKEPHTILVEYSSPNTNKPLHLGHIRNNLLGYSVAEILKAYGHHVQKINLINDRGIHICKSMLAWQIFGNNETPETSGLKGDHLVGKYYVLFDKHYKEEISQLIGNGLTEEEAKKKAPIFEKAQELLRKWENGDKETIELWEKMNSWVYSGFDETYKKLGVDFDKFYYESNTYILGKDIIEEGIAKQVFYKKEDGSTWINLTEEGLDEKLVLRSDGTSVYITQDIGTAILKHQEFKFDKSVYVVGNEQDYHFKVLFLILKKLGLTWADGCYHLSYGMVDLPSGKMKSREGTVVDADDLMQEMYDTAKEKTDELGKTDGFGEEDKNKLYETIGMGALKFFMLKVDPQKRMLFNPAESIDMQGDTGPFVQYTYARIQSLLKVANYTVNSSINTELELLESEKKLIVELLQYDKELKMAADNYSPSVIANYSLRLAKAFNRLYNDAPFVKEENEDKKQLRLYLGDKTANTIKTCLNLLGIQAPARM